MHKRPPAFLFVALLAILLLPACSSATPTATRTPAQTLRIIAGSEDQTLEPLLQEYAKRANLTLEMTYKGSVDIMLELERGSAIPYDAVWPANSLWIALGDKQGVVKAQESIWRSPVVFGVKKSVADRLGWVGRDVTVDDVLAASESGQLRFMMSSATQSNSGASAYMGFLYAFAGRPEVLTSDNLQDQGVRDKVKRILGSVNRSAGSSGWLKDLFLDQYGGYDAMVNYEALVIEANQTLTTSGREPLYAVYPVDGLAIADAPLGFVNKGDAKKEEAFRNLQAFLLTPETQNKILALGRRVGPLGLNSAQVDRNVFRSEWGIDVARTITPIRFPPPAVTREALTLYQAVFRKPSLTIYCLDFSGSMKGQHEQDLKTAMRLLLDQGQAATYLLQASPDDITVVIPFDSALRAEWTVVGNDPQALNDLYAKILQTQSDGGTDIYSPASRALEIIKSKNYENYASAVILLTDGESNTGQKLPDLQRQYSKLGFSTLPIYSILFGEASSKQLQEIATLTSGRVFDGKKNLIDAFREAKGYNRDARPPAKYRHMKLSGLLRNIDVVAGLGAVLLLLLCVFLWQVALPLSIVLAAVAYVGLRLALPKGNPHEESERLAATLARCDEQVTAIGQFAGWAGFAGKPEVRERLLAIARVAKRILAAIIQDPNKQGVAQQYLNEYLDPITSVLSSYVRLAGRDLALARDELAALEAETLPLIERRLTTLYEQIHSADLAALELDTKMLEYTLQPISMANGETQLDPAELPTMPEHGARRAAEPQGDALKEQAR